MNTKEWLEKLKQWWNPLATREKQAVLAGGSFLILLIFYMGIWQPLLHHIQVLRERVVSSEKTLSWMQSADNMLNKLNRSAAQKNKPVSLVVFLSEMQNNVKQAGLDAFLTQLKQSSIDSIELHFQKVEFDKMMGLLMMVMKEYPVTVTRLSVVASDASGLVNADMVIRQG